ncbi:MAG: hypothetical protein HY698_15775 [Deltaproteobacteria bacterium]|nr:hypothetical protein [Deltaproteobacteria bacterium]
MKTITEFSGSLLRRAAQARVSPQPDAGEPSSAAEASPASSDAESIGTALGVSGERLDRLMEALEVTKGKTDRVRLVRVYGGDSPPPSATKQGDHFYVVDLMPQPQRGGPRASGAARGGRREERHPRPGRGHEGERGEREPRTDEVPRFGVGWMLSRAPGQPGEQGRKQDRRGRKGPPGRRGRPPRDPKGVPAAQARVPAAQAGAPAAQVAPGAPKDARDPSRAPRRRRRRGRAGPPKGAPVAASQKTPGGGGGGSGQSGTSHD